MRATFAGEATDRQDVAKISKAVKQAIKSKSYELRSGELLTEAHIILEAKDENGIIRVYTIASMHWFSFINGIFTGFSGSGPTPTVITFKKNDQGNYSLLKYEEETSGYGGIESIKKLFPKNLWNQAMSSEQYRQELDRQEKSQAKEYLNSIGRLAKVSTIPTNLISFPIGAIAANNLLMISVHDHFLNECPTWLGTREQIENGIRYIYESSYSKNCDGHDLITFRKIEYGGRVIEQRKFKLVNDKPELMN